MSIGIKRLSPVLTTFITSGSQTRICNHKKQWHGDISCQSINLLDSSFYFSAINPTAESYLKISIIYIYICIYLPSPHFPSFSCLYCKTNKLQEIILGDLNSSINSTWSTGWSFANDFEVSTPTRPHVYSLPAFKSYLLQAGYVKLARLSQMLWREGSPSIKATAVKVIIDIHFDSRGVRQSLCQLSSVRN